LTEFEKANFEKPVFHFITLKGWVTRRLQALWVNCMQLAQPPTPAAALELVEVLLLALPRQLRALAVADQPRLLLRIRLFAVVVVVVLAAAAAAAHAAPRGPVVPHAVVAEV
jgi:hypothetical protein